MALMRVGAEADRVAIDGGWRQGDTLHGLWGDEHRRGLASQPHLSRLGTQGSRRTTHAEPPLQAGATEEQTLFAVADMP
jgi:hypothetical protein